jgi:hypothetical protein
VHKGAVDPCKIDAAGAVPALSTISFPSSHLGEGARLLTGVARFETVDGSQFTTNVLSVHLPVAQLDEQRATNAKVCRFESCPEGQSSACRGVRSSLPALEAGDRWFESTRADQFEIRRNRGGNGACAEGHGYFGKRPESKPATVSAACQVPQSESTLQSAVTSFLHGEWASAQSPLSLLARLRLRPSRRASACRDVQRRHFQPVVMAGLALKSTATSPSKARGRWFESNPADQPAGSSADRALTCRTRSLPSPAMTTPCHDDIPTRRLTCV